MKINLQISPPLYDSLLKVYSSVSPSKNMDDATDALNFSIGMTFVIMSVGFFFVLIDQFYHLFIQDSLLNLVIFYVNVLCPLMISVILRKMNHTLTIAVNLYRILNDSEYFDQTLLTPRLPLILQLQLYILPPLLIELLFSATMLFN